MKIYLFILLNNFRFLKLANFSDLKNWRISKIYLIIIKITNNCQVLEFFKFIRIDQSSKFIYLFN